jgi:hypothetical protein
LTIRCSFGSHQSQNGQAKRQYDRQKQLYDDKVISKLEFETPKIPIHG